MYCDCSFLKRIWLLLQYTYKRKYTVANAMFFIREEQSPNTAQGLVINCLSKGAQGFLWLSLRSGQYQPVPVYY